ncbi:hypothetical protein MZK49_25875 [Ensifer sesbaniae]|uniref:hypothetical protein n=1 Tax=Ensifer sesbaniae TaxID=1214071 RepID=UPI002000CFC6|nr:hypothetical protein [Ensifer sesbaniae]
MRGAGNEASSFRVTLFCLALAMVEIATVRAADTSGADGNGKPWQIQDANFNDFIKTNPDCLEFTDQCHTVPSSTELPNAGRQRLHQAREPVNQQCNGRCRKKLKTRSKAVP